MTKPLFADLTTDEADAYALVLSSSGIAFDLIEGDHGWEIYVDADVSAGALRIVEEHLREEAVAAPEHEAPSFQYRKTIAGVWVSLVMLALHVIFEVGPSRRDLIRLYGSAADHVLQGELYRTVTSLMIHADAAHLAGNILGIALFGSVVCQIMGVGVGLLSLLATGVGGNLINALLYRRGHVSIGASTAVFGAIGILSGYQFMRRSGASRGRTKGWAALGAGLALLAFLGSSRHSDLAAHLFGFAIGIIVGVWYAFYAKQPPGKLYQGLSLAGALSMVAASWICAYAAG